VSTTTIVLIAVAVAAIAAIAFFTLRARRDTAAVAASDTDEDPALSASGEAMIVGDVMPIDSNEPGLPPGTAQPPFRADSQTPRGADSETPPKQSQVYEARRQPDQPRRQPDEPPRVSEPSRASDPAQRQSELVEDCATQRAEIRWSKRFEPSDGAFDDATRLNLIRDLGIVRAPWGVPLLTQAYEEEPTAEHRRAALRALAAYRHPDTQPTFELALRADDEETRAIAANALSALRIRAALPS
jgi:HEAT repeat protein